MTRTGALLGELILPKKPLDRPSASIEVSQIDLIGQSASHLHLIMVLEIPGTGQEGVLQLSNGREERRPHKIPYCQTSTFIVSHEEKRRA